MFFIYEIRNVKTNTLYIGCTKSIDTRWKEHKTKLNANTHENLYLQRAWNKYGSEMFKFTKIQTVSNKKEMFDLEKILISECSNKYNIAPGGYGGDNITNHPQLDVVKKNMSDSQKKRYERDGERSKCNAFRNLTSSEYNYQCKKWSDVKKGPGNGRFKHNKPIARIDIKTNEIIQIYPYSCILKDYGFNGKYARLCADNHPSYKTHKGYIWRYV